MVETVQNEGQRTGRQASGRIDIKRVLKTTGAIIGFMIGAGFSTGQETLQYYTSEGWMGVVGAFVAYVCVFLLFYCFMVTGVRTGMCHSKDIFRYYCGKHIGAFYEIATVCLLFLVSVTMVSGAGAVFGQYFGISEAIGRGVMCLLILISVLGGLRKLLDVLGFLGPLIIVCLVVIAVVSLAGNPGGIVSAPEFIESCDPPILKASGFWLLSAVLYGMSNVYPLASYGSALGARSASKSEAVLGAALAAASLAIGASLVVLSQLANIEMVYDQAVPTLALVQYYMPAAAAVVFAIVLFLGIYTTVTPSVWAFAQHFGEDRSRRYTISTVLAVIGVFIVSFLPYEQLLNVVYPFSGYLAYFMIGAMIIKHAHLFMAKWRDKKFKS